MDRRSRLVAALACAITLAAAGTRLDAQSRQAASRQKLDAEYTAQDQGVPAGPAHHDRAGRSPAGVRHGAVAAQVPRPHRRHARRADLREGHPSLLRGARQGVRPRRGSGRSARPKKAATWSSLAIADEATIKRARQVQGRCSRSSPIRARRPRQQAQQLINTAKPIYCDHERHALAGDRRSRDADRAGVPARSSKRRRSSRTSATTSSRSSRR